MSTLVEDSNRLYCLPGGLVSGGESVLLIEDNPIDALRTMSLLRTSAPDLAVWHVSALSEATSELLAVSDCVLLDLSLPDAEDYEGLREILHRANIPVVVLTGIDAAAGRRLECLSNGAQDYLTKDVVSARALGNAVRAAIECRWSQVHLESEALLRAAVVWFEEERSRSSRRTRGQRSLARSRSGRRRARASRREQRGGGDHATGRDRIRELDEMVDLRFTTRWTE